MAVVQDRFDRLLCRESIRSALHRLGFSWKKARKLLGRADPARRMEFIQDLRALRDGAQRDRHELVYVDEAHIHQDVDPGYGWGVRGTPFHRAGTVQAAAARLNITIVPLPGYSPDLMPVEPLWRWLREDVTYQHCHATADDLIRRVAAFEDRVNASPYLLADRLWVKDQLDPAEEKLRFSK